MLLAGLCGHVAYAYYQFCDPVQQEYFISEERKSQGLKSKSDMLIPYMAVNDMKEFPGMAGIYAAAVYAGTLSSLSRVLKKIIHV